MKRIIAALLCAAMLLVLSGCTAKQDADISVTAAPDEAADAADQDVQDEAMPVIGAESTMLPSMPVSAYSYVPLTIESSGLYMEVPSHWERRPSSNSIYYLEPVEEGDVPGRIVFTIKPVSRIRSDTLANQLKSYFAIILEGFDTYEWSDVSTDLPFAGGKTAAWVTYSGTKGGIDYKGYVIMGARAKTIYVFHFRCQADDYDSFTKVIDRVRDSIVLTLEEEE